MDGASKFVRGDAIASVLSRWSTSSAGSTSEWSSRDALREASLVYKLTIGDGLVTQVRAADFDRRSPARHPHSVDSDLPGEIIGQMFIQPSDGCLGLSGGLSFTGLPRFL